MTNFDEVITRAARSATFPEQRTGLAATAQALAVRDGLTAIAAAISGSAGGNVQDGDAVRVTSADDADRIGYVVLEAGAVYKIFVSERLWEDQ